MGLITRQQKGSKKLFTGLEPSRLLNTLRTKQQLVENILPSLQAIYNVDPEKPNIKIADQVESVRHVYNNIFSYLAQKPQEELLIYGSLKDALENFEIEVVDYFYKIMGRSKNAIREIGNNDPETRRYFRLSRRMNPRHDIRLIRGEDNFQSTDNMLYGNTLVIFSVKQQIFAITIESATIAATYRAMFNLAWRSGKKL